MIIMQSHGIIKSENTTLDFVIQLILMDTMTSEKGMKSCINDDQTLKSMLTYPLNYVPDEGLINKLITFYYSMFIVY